MGCFCVVTPLLLFIPIFVVRVPVEGSCCCFVFGVLVAGPGCCSVPFTCLLRSDEGLWSSDDLVTAKMLKLAQDMLDVHQSENR